MHYVTSKRFTYSIKRIDLSRADRDGTLEHAKAFAMTAMGATLPSHAHRCIGYETSLVTRCAGVWIVPPPSPPPAHVTPPRAMFIHVALSSTTGPRGYSASAINCYLQHLDPIWLEAPLIDDHNYTRNAHPNRLSSPSSPAE